MINFSEDREKDQVAKLWILANLIIAIGYSLIHFHIFRHLFESYAVQWKIFLFIFVIIQFLNGFGIYKFRRYKNIFNVTIFLNILAVILAGELSFFASLDQMLFFAKQLYLLTVQHWE